ncbi:hypothetical protein KGF54_003055 [Candida jiufengensis]|uniref:uncharacterized protein n=1 Tax=Candida jiufengensis TaxID=497108 RepID=UPI00222405AB|nr:uncharacterized protein KGF54_003055 [Candida jiufengensis]KAI5953683.1 hypothetical protein KGF54_003055 [Candida jiufengensis]
MVLSYDDKFYSEDEPMEVNNTVINESDNSNITTNNEVVLNDETNSFSTTQFDFNSAEWDYLRIAQHSVHNQTMDNNGIEISPSISNHTLQSLRPTFSSEYDTDNTDFLGLVESTNQSNINLSTNSNSNIFCENNITNNQHLIDNLKANHEFTFQHSLDANYWDYMLEKENLLHDEFELNQFNNANNNKSSTNIGTKNSDNKINYNEDETNNTQEQSLSDNINSENNEHQEIDNKDSDLDVPSIRSTSTSFLSDHEKNICNITNLNDDIPQYKPIYERYENEALDEEMEENERLYHPNLQTDPIEKTIDQQIYQFSERKSSIHNNIYGASSLSSLMSEMSPDSPSQNHFNLDEITTYNNNFVNSPIYEWPDDETTGTLNSYNRIKIQLKNLEPKIISDAVLKTIREEFIIQDLFLNGESPPTPEIPKSIRKKSDRDVEWTPLSVYKAYTNIKSPTNGKDSYNRLVPYTSCIGTLNYRPKDHAAWKRSPNRR